MAAVAEDWRDLEAVVADGLAENPWEPAAASRAEAETPRKAAAQRKAGRR